MNRFHARFMLFILISLWFLPESQSVNAATVALFVDGGSPQAMFASSDIQSSLEKKGHKFEQFGLEQLDRKTDGTCIILAPRSNAKIIRKMQSAGGRPPGR